MIKNLTELRQRYPAAKERSVLKQLTHLDPHCICFIGLSPFVVLASSGNNGHLDTSPRGGPAGFVRVADSHTLLLPDSPGNNRLDTLENVVATGELGLLFMIPGVDETLRVNGAAQLRDEATLLESFRDEKRRPRLVIEIKVREAYLHCAKAMMRSKLWDGASKVNRSVLPTMGQMLSDQTGTSAVPETQEQMIARYTLDL